MRNEPHPSLNVFWGLKFNDGTHALEDIRPSGQRPEWFYIQSSVSDKKYPVLLKLFKREGDHKPTYSSVGVGKNAKNFFFSKRASMTLGESSSKENYGLGYYNGDGSKVYIKWFDEKLSLVQEEERDLEKCIDLMIPKITTASSSQSLKSQYTPSLRKQ